MTTTRCQIESNAFSSSRTRSTRSGTWLSSSIVTARLFRSTRRSPTASAGRVTHCWDRRSLSASVRSWPRGSPISRLASCAPIQRSPRCASWSTPRSTAHSCSPSTILSTRSAARPAWCSSRAISRRKAGSRSSAKNSGSASPKHLRKEGGTIYQEADRTAKIVRNLLVFTGSRRLARRAVSLPPILQKVVALRSAACRASDIEVVRHYDQKMPRVQSDPLLLHQVFLNIMMNAEQAIASLGKPGRIEIASKKEGDRIVTTVRDSGPGIPEEARSRIFEPFYTTKEVGKGTGLGLAIAYGIVQEHGGEIHAANHPEGGAMFTVELPIKPGAERAKG